MELTQNNLQAQAFLRVVPFNLDRPQNIIEFISPQDPRTTTEL